MFCLCVCVCPWCLAACPGKVGAAGTATQTHSTHSQLWPCSAFTTWIERRDFEESISHKAGFTVGACDVMTWDVRVGGWCTVHLVWTPESREDAARPDVHCRLSNESQTVQTVFITTWGLMDYFHSILFYLLIRCLTKWQEHFTSSQHKLMFSRSSCCLTKKVFDLRDEEEKQWTVKVGSTVVFVTNRLMVNWLHLKRIWSNLGFSFSLKDTSTCERRSQGSKCRPSAHNVLKCT